MQKSIQLTEVLCFHRAIKTTLPSDQLVVLQTEFGYTSFDHDAQIIGQVLNHSCGEFVVEDVPVDMLGALEYKMIHLAVNDIRNHFTALLNAGYNLLVADRK